MYSWEIEKLLAEKGGVITRDDLYKIVNNVETPQIKDVKPVCAFEITTDDGYSFKAVVKD